MKPISWRLALAFEKKSMESKVSRHVRVHTDTYFLPGNNLSMCVCVCVRERERERERERTKCLKVAGFEDNWKVKDKT
jgi:hypothetical protein